MLKSQKYQIEQSKRRERMAAIQNTEGDLSADAVTELRSLTSAYEAGEVDYRAAVILEDAEKATIKTQDKAATDWERECRSFSLSAVIASALDGKPITGREAEVSQELEQRNGGGHKGGLLIPFEALETRADVPVTTATAEAGNLASRPVMSALERLFADSAAERFGFRTVAVSGKPSWPEITGGASAHWVGEGNGADAEAISTTTRTPSIKTCTARYLLSRQSVKENPALESVLRRDLSGVMREAIDLAAFQGTGTANQPLGLIPALIAAGRVSEFDALASFGPLFSEAIQIMEAAKLADVSKIKFGAAPAVLEALVNDLVGATALSSLDRLKSAIGQPVFSSQISATAARNATGKGASTVVVGAPEGLALLPTWGAAELVVDPYSESRSGKIALTVFQFTDVLVQRISTHFKALTGVQAIL